MIYIGVPAYNEASTAGVVLWKIRRVMGEFGRDYEILFLDDGSTDGTGQAVERYRRLLPLTVLRNDSRRGYAASVEAVLREAVCRSPYPKRDVAVILQGDFSEDPAAIVPLVKRIEGGADVVLAGVRNGPGGMGGPRALRWARRVCGWARVRLGLPPDVADPFSGLRAYRIVTLKRAFDAAGDGALLRTEGWTSNVELLARVVPFARRIDEEAAALRRDRLQRPARFRAWRLWRDLLRLLAKPVRTEAALTAPAPPRWRSRPRGGRARGRKRRVG